MLKRTTLIAASLLIGISAAVADPSGRYKLEGTNPGGNGKYTGSITVERTGETYRVIWVVGSETYVGTGIGNKDFLAVSYKSGDSTGLALYGVEGDGWSGVWTYAGGNKMGAERWYRK